MDRQRPASNRKRQYDGRRTIQEKTPPTTCKSKMGPPAPGHDDHEASTERRPGTPHVLRSGKHDTVRIDAKATEGMVRGTATVLELTTQDLDDIVEYILAAVDTLQTAVDRATVTRQAAQDAAAVARGLVM